jgi:hypothetical protein
MWNDLNGRILPSGLFWTVDLRKSAVDFKMSNRRAVLHAKNMAVIDTFRFLGPSDTPALVDPRVEWEATGPAVPRGRGTEVPPTDPASFLGEIAPAVSTISFSADEIGFEFESNRGASTSPRGYAQLGTERNGIFLS